MGTKIQPSILTILFILLASSASYSQEYVDYKGAEACAKTIILKLKQSTGHLKSHNPSNFSPISTEIKSIASALSAEPISQLFRQASTADCKKCVDLSTIYEIKYHADISLEKAISYFSQLASVEYAEPRYLSYPASTTPDGIKDIITLNDPYFSQQYELRITEANRAWAIDSGSKNIIIGIPDTGFDISHEDLVDKIAYNTEDPINNIDDDLDGYVDNFRGWDFGSKDNNPSPESSEGNHGTTVAGFAAAENNNSKGIASAGYNCRFLPIKIANYQNAITHGYEGVVYAADHGCQIINCSWGNSIKSKFGQDVVNYATYNKDALVIGAAGNSGNDIPLYPASYDATVGVAGTDRQDQRWGNVPNKGSSYGYTVNISAPGTGMTTTGANSTYTPSYGGTSFAAPIVASIAGLVRNHFPTLSAIETAEQLKATTDLIDTIQSNIDYTKQLGFGRVNAYNALSDTTKAAIYLENISVYDKNDSIFINGDTLWISGDFVNYLHSAKDISVSMEVISFYIKGDKTAYELATIGTKESKHARDIFSIVLPPSLPLDFTATVRFDFEGSNCYGYQYFTVKVNQSNAQLATENSSLMAFSDGVIGNHYYGSTYTPSLLFKNENTLFDAGFMIGQSSNVLLSCFRNNKDFTIKKRLTAVNDKTGVYQNIFSDTIIAGVDYLGIDIIQNTYLLNNEDSYIIEYGIHNNSNIKLENLRAGVFADWEVMHPYLNEERYRSSDKLAYVYSNEPGSHYCGLSLISENKAIHHVLDINHPDNEGINLNDGFDKEEKFIALTTENEYKPKNILGTDIAHVMSAEPFDLESSDTAWIAFAITLAEDENTLINRNRSAKITYQKLKGTYIEPTVSIQSTDYSLYVKYQNSTETLQIINVSGEEWETHVLIVNSQGNILLQKSINIDEINTTIPFGDRNTGIYYLTLSDKKGSKKTFTFINK